MSDSLYSIMRRLILPLLLATAAPAQQLWPYNVEFHPTAVVQPILYRQTVTPPGQYVPAVAVQFVPAVASPFVSLHPNGLPVTLVLRELLVGQPPGWTGMCRGFAMGTRIVDLWSGPSPLVVLPWTGYGVDHWKQLANVMPWTCSLTMDHGTWQGACWGNATVPEWAVAVFEVR